ncbi:MAG: vacuolar protein-sorting-associated protein 33-like protein [Harvfovirus sp.]|uniref:Vacuolar protein-sorting-associated protein 33-like protein n=1 Tax=Harvfovirus sp. TaxID=2487768 RepID=A0A3G5A3Y4_9VIRU|nr:MAG: vacuolar protein-sorting-associated protein 33-like protein [Harvfovirus sp.]
MYSIIRNRLRLATTYGELRKLYGDQVSGGTKKEKYDIYKEIENLDIGAAAKYLNEKAKRIKELQIQMAEAPTEMTLEELHVLLGNKGGFDNFSQHLKNLSFYNLFKISFARQNELENKMLDGSYDVKECSEFLCDLIDRNVPYVRVLKFMIILFVSNRIEMDKLISLKRLGKEMIEYIKKGFVQMYGFGEIITLKNLEKIVGDIDKWRAELEKNDVVEIITEWKQRKPGKFVAGKNLMALELYAVIL